MRERDFKDLIDMIQKREKLRLRVESGLSQNSLTIHNTYGDKVLQFKVIPEDKLVIQHISFQNPRKGLGTLVVERLKDYANSQNISTILVENGTTEAIVKFAKKHGFKPVQGEVFIKEDGVLYGNYELSLTTQQKEDV
jgi:hypothetical protein